MQKKNEAYFEKIYAPLGKRILVFNKRGKMIYHTRQADLLIAHGLPECFKTYAKACVREETSQIFSFPLLTVERRVTVVPAYFEEETYAVAEVEFEPQYPDESMMVTTMSRVMDITSRSLNSFYYEALCAGIKDGKGYLMGLDLQHILRGQELMSRFFDIGKRDFFEACVDINQYVETYSAVVESLGARHKVLIDSLEQWTVGIICPRDLEFVLASLVSNAFRFSAGDVKIRTTIQEDRVRLTVADSGDPVAEPERIFDCGYRSRDLVGRIGFGMSLTVAARTLERQDARIVYERAEGENRFHIEMKRYPYDGNGTLLKWRPDIPPNELDTLQIGLCDYFVAMDGLCRAKEKKERK